MYEYSNPSLHLIRRYRRRLLSLSLPPHQDYALGIRLGGLHAI